MTLHPDSNMTKSNEIEMSSRFSFPKKCLPRLNTDKAQAIPQPVDNPAILICIQPSKEVGAL